VTQLLGYPAPQQNFVQAVHSVFWPLLMGMPDVQELQEARPQLPLPQGSLDVQEAAQQSAILASKHLSSRCVAALLFFLRFSNGFSAENTHKHRKV
jgi:hypothetical protein